MDTNGLTAITPEIRKELSAIFQQEMAIREQQKKESRTAYRRVFKEFQREFERFDYATTSQVLSITGETHISRHENVMHWKVRNAIGTLLRAMYQVGNVESIPAGKEVEMREFVQNVLDLMKEKTPADAVTAASAD